MSLFNVYITKASISRESDPTAWRTVIYRKCVRSSSRIAALEKCLPDIRKTIIPQVDKSIKRVAVYVGRKGIPSLAANRLEPYRITNDGEEIIFYRPLRLYEK